MTQVHRFEFWLIFSRSGGVRTTKRLPSLDMRERAMQCQVDLPKSLFTRPQLKATINVPEIDTEVPEINIEAAETALAEVLGVDVSFTVKHPEEDNIDDYSQR